MRSFLAACLLATVAAALHLRSVATPAPAPPAYCVAVSKPLIQGCERYKDCLGFVCRNLDPGLLTNVSMAVAVRFLPCEAKKSGAAVFEVQVNNTLPGAEHSARWRFNATQPPHFFGMDFLPVAIPNLGAGHMFLTADLSAKNPANLEELTATVALRACTVTNGVRKCYAPAYAPLFNNGTIDYSSVICG